MVKDPHEYRVETNTPRLWEQEQTFQDVMAEQLQHAPWFGLSVLIHLVVFGIFLLIPGSPRKANDDFNLTMAPPQQEEKIEEIEEEEEKPEEEEPEEEPILKDAEISDHNEDISEEDFQSVQGEELNADSTFDKNAFNDTIGIGGGAGGKFGGRFGGKQRLRTRGGGQATAEAVRLGLEWLAKHQDEDGHWDVANFMKHDGEGTPCDGPGNPLHDVGITGLALLAFLGDGNTMRAGPYKHVVKKSVVWLKEQQNDDGLFGTDASHEFMYNHAIAALAMCEAYGLSEYKLLRQFAQKGVNYVQNARNPYKVWRYYPRNGDNDSSVTGWMVLVLKSAEEFKLTIDRDAFRYAGAWFDEVTDPSTGQCGYTKRGENSSRKEGMQDKFPPSKTEAMTAVGLLSRFFLGQDPKTTPVMAAAASTMLKKPPVWNPADGSIDMYYWYYASFAMFQMGGNDWDQWNKKMVDAVVKPQRKDSNFRGSWDPIGAWGEDGGRVYSTAIMVLCLEVYFRYSRIIGGR
jgi:hypothetical protein